MKKLIALILIFLLFALSGNVFAKERKGADVIIQSIDGIRVRGELIAVKQDSILLLDKYLGADMTIDFRNIGVIKIVRESNALAGGIIGLVIGGAIGFLIGYPQGDDNGFVIISRPQAGGIGAAIGGVLGALIGIGIGEAVRSVKTIQIEGKSDSELKEILEKLRKKARVQNFQ